MGDLSVRLLCLTIPLNTPEEAARLTQGLIPAPSGPHPRSALSCLGVFHLWGHGIHSTKI